MELDQENSVAATPAVQEMETPVIQEEESPANKAIREKLAWFGPNPMMDVVLKVMYPLAEEAKHKREAELQLKLAAAQQAAAHSPNSEYSTAPPIEERGEVQIPVSMEEECQRRLQEMRIQHRGPVSKEVLLGWSDVIRCQLWKEALALEQQNQGEVVPYIYARYWPQYDV